MPPTRPYQRVLGLYPCRRGFGFAVMEGGRGLIDWGAAELGEDSDVEFLVRVERKIRRCAPALLVLEDCQRPDRSARALRRTEDTILFALRAGLLTAFFTAGEVNELISLPVTATKHQVAEHLCGVHPELMPHLPVPSLWRRDPRMNIFRAIALAAAGLAHASRPKSASE